MNTFIRNHLNALLTCVALGASLAVFSLYTQPAFLQVLANQWWECL